MVGKTDPIERGLRRHTAPLHLFLPTVGKTDPIERGLRPRAEIDSALSAVGKTDPIERGLRPCILCKHKKSHSLEKQTR